jgi:hypothetical protein
MNKMLVSTLAICASLSLTQLTGCASIVDGQHQSISVETPPVSDATCSLANNKGVWFIPATPGSVVVHRSYYDLVVTCHRPGYESRQVSVKSFTKPMAFGNIIFGGAIGAGVDVVDGSAYDYPVDIVVPMKPGNE